jgi:hypothetical protein
LARSAVDGATDARVRAATADVASHGLVNFRVGRLRFADEQGCRRHNLPGLAVTALRNLFGDPRLDYRVSAVSGKSFDGRNFFPSDAGNRSDAGASWLAIDVHRACTALGNPAAEFRARQIQRIAQHPKKWGIGIHVYCFGFSIDAESDRSHETSLRQTPKPAAEAYFASVRGSMKSDFFAERSERS